MRRLVKRALKRTLSSRPGWWLLGPLLRGPGVIVLTYHRILGGPSPLPGTSIEAFTAQMGWLRRSCDLIAPEALVERLHDRRRTRPAVLVTFDDGYRDYHDLAYPVLARLGIPAVVFLTTAALDEGGMLWTDDVQWAARATGRDRVRLPWHGGIDVTLPDLGARDALSASVRAHLKTLPDADRRAALAALLAELDAPSPAERQMLSWDEVRRTMDLTRYGGHSHTHPILSRLPRAQAVAEIRTCRDRIAAETGRAPILFAYPNGRPADYTAETQQILREHGFTTAFASTERIAGKGSDLMAVERLAAAELDIPDFAWVAGGWMRS